MTMLHANISINDPSSLIYFAAFYDLRIGVVWYNGANGYGLSSFVNGGPLSPVPQRM
jgi:hypothetical protein